MHGIRYPRHREPPLDGVAIQGRGTVPARLDCHVAGAPRNDESQEQCGLAHAASQPDDEPRSLVLMLMMMPTCVSSSFGIERRFHRVGMAAQALHHLGNHMVRPDADAVAEQLHG